MGRLLRATLELGARLAEPGEFTRRAFLNGRVDLPTAEALLGVIEAGSERGLRVAQAQLGGELGEELRLLRERVVGLLAIIEASIDFPEDGVPATEWSQFRRESQAISLALGALVASFELGKALRSGVTVALTGPVNAGKSSLFNALAGRERALVSAQPGTTRDYVEVELVWSGVPITLIDTAGERESSEELETRGIELGRRRAEQADLEVALVPPGATPPRGSKRVLAVASKSDTGESTLSLRTSASTGEGLDDLRAAIIERMAPGGRDAEDGLIVTSERQRDHLQASRAAMEAALALGSEQPELIAVELRTASDRLAQCLGEEIGDEVLDDLFARFCIGK